MDYDDFELLKPRLFMDLDFFDFVDTNFALKNESVSDNPEKKPFLIL